MKFLHYRILSGWRDSNSRPPAPKAGILTGLNYIPHTSFSKASAKVLLFFDMTKYFQKKMQKIFIFFHISAFFCTFARFSGVLSDIELVSMSRNTIKYFCIIIYKV